MEVRSWIGLCLCVCCHKDLSSYREGRGYHGGFCRERFLEGLGEDWRKIRQTKKKTPKDKTEAVEDG